MPSGICVLLTLLLAGPLAVHADWQLAWSDEFNQADGSSPNPANWGFDVGGGGWGNAQLEYDTSRTNNARIVGGQLVIEAKPESYGGNSYTSARMLTKGKFSIAYGRIEASIKIPRGQGIWPAFWMLGTNIDSVSWPTCGEIDIMENIGNISDQGTDHGTIHGPQGGGDYNGGSGVGGTYTLPGGAALADNFHLYAVEWTTNQIKWYLDGINYFTATPASLPGGSTWVFTQPQFIILNVAVGGNWPGNPDGTAVFPQQMLVDYVRVYTNVPTPPTAPSVPTGLTVSPGSASVYLNWNASSSGATGYIVQRATVSGGPYTAIASVGSNNYTDTGLANCSSYYYVVTATNSVGPSTNSSEQVASLGAYALAINSGGNAAGQFVADTAYVSGGTVAAPTTSAIDTTAVTNPAPQAVYQTERYGAFTYTFGGLTPGLSYKVRLHFVEFYWNSANARKFNVAINGTQILANYDIFAAAGGQNKAIVREFSASPNGSGKIVIAYTVGTADQPKSSGVEILLPQSGAPAGLAAVPGDSQASLNWNQVVGAMYNVKRSVAGSGPFTPVFTGLTTTNYVDSGLTNGVAYYYVVSAAIIGCESTNSIPLMVTPNCTPPSAPSAGNNGPIWAGTTLSLTASTVPGATYSWTGPNGFASTNQNPSVLNASTSASGTYGVTATTGSCSSVPGTTVVTVNPPSSVSFQSLSGNIVLSWPGGFLQSAPDLSGPWTDITGATSPFTNPAAASQAFYRLRLQ